VAGIPYIFYLVSYKVTGSANPPTIVQINAPLTSTRIPGLTPSTSYDFTVTGVVFVNAENIQSVPSAVSTFVTAAPDAKLNPNEDIHNINCVQFIDNLHRVSINCSWTAPVAPGVNPTRIGVKCHCISQIREPVLIHKRLFGAKASATSVVFHVHRDVTTCAIYLHAYYPRRPATRHHFILELAH